MTPSTTATTLRLSPVPFCVDAVSADSCDRLIWHEDCAKHITVIPKRLNLGHKLYAVLESYGNGKGRQGTACSGKAVAATAVAAAGTAAAAATAVAAATVVRAAAAAA